MSSFDDLGTTVDKHLGDGASDVAVAEGRRRFVDSVERLERLAPDNRPLWPSPRAPWRSRLVPAAVVVGGLALVIGLIDIGYRHGRPTAVPSGASGLVEGEQGAPERSGDVVRLETSREQSGATVQLVSGATVTLSHRTRGESRRVGPNAYRVTLDYGEMTFTIDPHIGSTWIIDAGVCEIRVVGTIFAVTRDPGQRTIGVRVQRGRVAVSGTARDGRGGPLGERTVMLNAGGVLSVSGDALRIVQPDPAGPSVRGDAVLGSAATPPTARPTLAPPPLAHSSAARRGTAGAPPSGRSVPSGRAAAVGQDEGATSPPQHDWTALYRVGDYAGAWRAARELGYGELASTADATTVAHLADAARLAGDATGARAVLLALRRRFPQARESSNAAFLLGRSAAERPGGLAEAASWFEAYLAERPAGVYAEEARGRLMVVHQRAGRMIDARRVARDYLARYPAGSYAGVARSLSP